MLNQLLTQSCTITRNLTSADSDEYGDEIPDAEVVETTCSLQQTQAQEPTQENEVSVTRWLLVLPANTDLRTSDVVTIGGKNYQVAGDATNQWNPRMRAYSHVEANVIRTAGGEEEGS